MAIAEEQRRRKALEERRKAQHEATARFKSAICRIKSNPKAAAKHKPLDDVESALMSTLVSSEQALLLTSTLSIQSTSPTRPGPRLRTQLTVLMDSST